MRSFPHPYPNEIKVFSACGASVARKDCHRNRYGDYVCHACQGVGITSTRRGRLRHGTLRTLLFSWLGTIAVFFVGLLVWAFYALFESVDLFAFMLPALQR